MAVVNWAEKGDLLFPSYFVLDEVAIRLAERGWEGEGTERGREEEVIGWMGNEGVEEGSSEGRGREIWEGEGGRYGKERDRESISM